MLKKILNRILLKKHFNKKKSVVWLQIPTDLNTQADRDNLMEATMNQLEKIIYKNFPAITKKNFLRHPNKNEKNYYYFPLCGLSTNVQAVVTLWWTTGSAVTASSTNSPPSPCRTSGSSRYTRRTSGEQ